MRKAKITFELTKVTKGQEASEPNFFYVDDYDRIYYGHTKQPHFCDECGDVLQLIWTGNNMHCLVCDGEM